MKTTIDSLDSGNGRTATWEVKTSYGQYGYAPKTLTEQEATELAQQVREQAGTDCTDRTVNTYWATISWAASDAQAAEKIYALAISAVAGKEEQIRLERRKVKLEQLHAALLSGAYKDVLVRNAQGRIQSLRLSQ